ncbi:MAG: CCA tRNA nucleotidyltransferase, partial [Bacilli bacterium]
ELPIFSIKDIAINAKEICLLLNKKAGPFIKEIYKTLETKILSNELNNDSIEIKKYLIRNFK